MSVDEPEGLCRGRGDVTGRILDEFHVLHAELADRLAEHPGRLDSAVSFAIKKALAAGAKIGWVEITAQMIEANIPGAPVQPDWDGIAATIDEEWDREVSA
jgi:hypothetical protein